MGPGVQDQKVFPGPKIVAQNSSVWTKTNKCGPILKGVIQYSKLWYKTLARDLSQKYVPIFSMLLELWTKAVAVAIHFFCYWTTPLNLGTHISFLNYTF